MPTPGETISHYRILEKLGEGGMGVVYRAQDTKLARQVALKFVTEPTSSRGDGPERVRREARSAARLRHPHICVVYDIDEHEGRPFIAMELLEGRTLDRHIDGKPLDVGRAVEIGRQVASALEAAHAKGVVHRDLKPGNVFVTAENQAKVLDFGLAKLLQPEPSGGAQTLTATQAVLGTLPYMAPEQLREEEVDVRADVWALGSLLYEMVVGERPFQGGSGPRLVESILHDTPEPPRSRDRDVPEDLERLILRCLEKDPASRYQSVAEVRIELERIGADLEPTGVPPGWPTAKASRRRLVLLAAAATVVAILAVTLGVWSAWVRAPDGQVSSAQLSIAVLPFENMSPEPENEYFSRGLTEEIISKLSRIEGLSVASRSSIMRYADPARDIELVGKELGVRYVLEGSVRKAGGRVRITAKLIDASTNFRHWSEDFEGSPEDIFALQEETALEIADALDLELTPRGRQAVLRRDTESSAAYDALLRGQATLRALNPDAAQSHFEEALELDPGFARAWAGLAEVHSYYYRNVETDPSRLEQAKQCAQRAIDADPDLAEAHRALGHVYASEYDYEGAEREFLEAVHRDPTDPSSWNLLAWARTYRQPPRANAAEEAAREAIRRDRSLPGAHYQLGRALLLQSRYEEATHSFEHALELMPSFGPPRLGLAEVHLAQGDPDRALSELGLLDRLDRSPVILVQLAAVRLAQGDERAALETLEKALDAGYRDFAYLDASPYFDALRQEPRFQELLVRFR